MSIRFIAGIACLLAFAAQDLLAQGRGGVTIRDPGALRTPGSSSPVSSFRGYSSGVGQGSAGGFGSALDLTGSHKVNSGGGASDNDVTNSSFDVPTARSGGRVYAEPSDMPVTAEENSGLERALRNPLAIHARFGVAVSFLLSPEAMESKEDISSLVPKEPSTYSEFLQAGEKSFRDGDFPDAYSKFRMANFIYAKDPSTLLSMSHAQFALNSYASAAYYLRQAIRALPDLPLLRLSPRDFYGDPSVYVESVLQLEDYLNQHPGDTDAQFLMAYYSWFDSSTTGGPAKARKAMAAALAGKCEPEMIDAIESFYESMLVSGKVTGKLTPMAVTSDKAPGATTRSLSTPSPRTTGKVSATRSG